MTQGPPWDGAPLPPPSVPGTIQLVRSPSTAAPVGPWVLLAAALGAVLGALLPWAVLELQVGPGLRTHLAGTDGDGVATLMLGLVLGLAAVVAFLQPRLGLWAGILGLVAGSATTLIAVRNIVDVGSGASRAKLVTPVETSVGSGLWVTLVAGIAGLIGGTVLLVRRRAASRRRIDT